MNQATQLAANDFSFFILFPQKREGNNSPIRLTPHEWTKFTRMEFFQEEKRLQHWQAEINIWEKVDHRPFDKFCFKHCL